jgi:hypothetical protein
VVKAENAETIPQGLKPDVYYVVFAARLKSCPFKTRLLPQAAKSFVECVTKGKDIPLFDELISLIKGHGSTST